MTSCLDSTKIAHTMEAEDQYKAGLDLKSKGQSDAALTAFRRAVISNPAHLLSHLEIGFLCREKAKVDKIFLRYAFEAFQKAARLDPLHEQAHTYYITLGQQTGALENLMDEYSALTKKFPENELLKKSHKNIMTLSMAMMPAQVNVNDGLATGGLRKFLMVTSIILIVVGLSFIVAPPILFKKGKIEKNQVANMVRLGFLIETVAIGGFIFKSRL